MIQAIIFDMDGVISDTQKIHSKVEHLVLKNHGIHISAKVLTEEYAGTTDHEFFKMIVERYQLPVSLKDMITEKWKHMMELTKNHVPQIPGALRLIQLVKSHHCKLGVASSSPSVFIKHVLVTLKIDNQFDAVASGQEVRKGKPEPDVFLLAAKRLHKNPESCVVIEDSFQGMTAAKNAGMRCIGLVKDKATMKYPADLLVSHFDDSSIRIIGHFLRE